MSAARWLRSISKRSRGMCVLAGNSSTSAVPHLEINGRSYVCDEMTNVTPKILSYLNRNLHLQKHHPLSLVRASIVDYFHKSYANVKGSGSFSVFDRLSPVVSSHQNFDSLLVPEDHPSRSKSDCYYINSNTVLRAHTTAHQSELIRSGLDNFLIVGEVYRRDAIDSTHFPVFHQLDALRSQTRDQLFPDIPDLSIFEHNSHPHPERQSCHTLEAVKVMEYQLKHALIGMIKHLFGENIDFRWVDAYFPFTHPSWELEVYYNQNWLEVLGCGIVKNEIMQLSGSKHSIAYAFGLGLERLAMALYDIPDIRLFWSLDSGFLNQFQNNGNKIIKYKPISQYPQCPNDISFWLPEMQNDKDNFCENDFYELVRDVGGDIVEQVLLIDQFKHPKSGKTSLCFRIVYRHMERSLTQDEVNVTHKKIEKAVTQLLGVAIR